jgi:hypothetical protein
MVGDQEISTTKSQIPIAQFLDSLKRYLVFFGNFGHWNVVIV